MGVDYFCGNHAGIGCPVCAAVFRGGQPIDLDIAAEDSAVARDGVPTEDAAQGDPGLSGGPNFGKPRTQGRSENDKADGG